LYPAKRAPQVLRRPDYGGQSIASRKTNTAGGYIRTHTDAAQPLPVDRFIGRRRGARYHKTLMKVHDINSMLVSALAHLAVMIVLGLVASASHDGWQRISLMAAVGESVEAAAGPVQLFQEIAMPASDIAALDAPAENSLDASGFDGLALGGAGEGEGALHPAATEFFGIGGYGQSFVYVVDCSGSMQEREKFDRARYELMHSLEQLGSDQRYFVIFFSDGAYPMDSDELVPATEEQRARTADWIRHLQPDGGTNPLPALLVALTLRPDAIYFLSDGKFDPATVTQMRIRNRKHRLRRQIPIHTIAFVDRSTEGLMRAIARNSGGKYRFVK
jgi:hypothetical protein